jgi:hypothetical protein
MLITSRAAVPVTVTVPCLSLAVGAVAAPAGVAIALNAPAAVAIMAEVAANRRRFIAVFISFSYRECFLALRMCSCV